MKKIIASITILLLSFQISKAQTQGNPKRTGQKTVEASKKINDKTREYSESSLEASENMKQSADNLKSVANNVKGVIMIFEPITKLHIFKSKKNKTRQKEQYHEQGERGNNEV